MYQLELLLPKRIGSPVVSLEQERIGITSAIVKTTNNDLKNFFILTPMESEVFTV